MRKTKLFKSLLVVAGMLVGSSAWATNYNWTFDAYCTDNSIAHTDKADAYGDLTANTSTVISTSNSVDLTFTSANSNSTSRIYDLKTTGSVGGQSYSSYFYMGGAGSTTDRILTTGTITGTGTLTVVYAGTASGSCDIYNGETKLTSITPAASTAVTSSSMDLGAGANLKIVHTGKCYIYAVKWTASSYSVTYKANGGTGDDIVDGNATTIAANTFTKTNCTFVGWNTAANGTGTSYAVGASVTSDLTLYAQWTETIYTKSLSDWATSDVTKTEGTLNKWYNSTGITNDVILTGMMIDAEKGLRLAARNTTATATLKYNHTTNSIVTIDAIWNVGSASSDSNTPNNKFQFGDLLIQQNVRSNNLTTTYTINGSTKTVGTDKFAREDDMTIHLKVNSYNGSILEFSLKNGETEVASFSELTSTTNHFAADSKYDEVTMTSWMSGSKAYAWCALKSITISEQEQAVYSYTVNAVDESSNILYKKAEGTVLYSDNSVTVTYDAFYLKGNSLLMADRLSSDGKSYSYTFNVTGNNQVNNIVYKDKSYDNVIFYKEAENIGTLTSVNSGNVPVRCSGGKGGYAASDAVVVSLPAGKYKVSSFAYGISGTDLDIYAGATKVKTFTTASTTLGVTTSDEFTLDATTDIIFKQGGNGGSSPKVLDFIFIQNTSDNEIVGAVDYSTASNGAISSDITLKKGETKVVTFQNHGQDYGKNWKINVKQGGTWKANVRADSWDEVANAETKVSYQVSKDGGSSKVALDWSEYQADMADARCVATLAYGTDGTLAITTTSTGVANGYIYYVDQDVTGLTGDLTINLSVNESWLEVLSVEQTAFSVTIPSSSYGSLAVAQGLDFSGVAGLTAYVVTKTTTEAVTLSSVEELPANSGVILKGTAGATYSIPVKADAAYAGTNLLSAAVTATNIAANEAYILQGGKFCLVTEASTVPAGKAYLLATNVPSTARTMNFVFEDETQGISAVETTKAQDGQTYNLAGQRVKNAVKGLYIVNGKKVIIK